MAFGSIINRPCVVGGVGSDRLNAVTDIFDDLNADCAVVDVAAGQDLSDDLSQGVDFQVQLPPAAAPFAAMFGGSPFTFAYDREATAVDDQVVSVRREPLSAT